MPEKKSKSKKVAHYLAPDHNGVKELEQSGKHKPGEIVTADLDKAELMVVDSIDPHSEVSGITYAKLDAGVYKAHKFALAYGQSIVFRRRPEWTVQEVVIPDHSRWRFRPFDPMDRPVMAAPEKRLFITLPPGMNGGHRAYLAEKVDQARRYIDGYNYSSEEQRLGPAINNEDSQLLSMMVGFGEVQRGELEHAYNYRMRQQQEEHERDMTLLYDRIRELEEFKEKYTRTAAVPACDGRVFRDEL